ncbi:MAG TPA: pyridoxal phosphate-dependent aminotransferase [Candidatus Kapabacteria bacterium]|jgi:aspartate aminotransferase|nr:pyridoxal phosphate-dependent aminotransferase [Candidatus Kapabacteria bacterium]
MSISLIARDIKESATLMINEKAAVLKQKGEPIIHLGGGEPKSKAPMSALLAATSIINSGEVRYAPADGIPELKQAIIKYTEDYYKIKVAPENVIASSGAKQAIMVALQAILNPQEEVMFPAPYWVSYSEMVKMCGAIPVPVLPEDGSFQPRIEDFEKRCTSYTKAVIINSPNNPTGAVYSRQFIKDIVAFCEEKGLYLIMDDIYHRLVFDDAEWVNVYDYAKELTDTSKVIIVNGVSKQYAMTGFRIGWAVANRKLQEVMRILQGHQTSGPSVVMQKAAVGALNGVQSQVESLRVTLQNNCKVMMERLNAFDGIRVTKPQGAFYSFVDFSYYEKDSRKLADFLLDKVRVATVPGIDFGMEGYLRLSTCGSIKDITEGTDRIKWALDPNSPNELYIGQRKLVRDWL